MNAENSATGAEEVIWDLTDLYHSIDDPQIDHDLELFEQEAAGFHREFAGQLATRLGDALTAEADLVCRHAKLRAYLDLCLRTDSSNEHIQQRLAKLNESYSRTNAKFLNFVDHELAKIDDSVVQTLCDTDPVVARHRPYLEQKGRARNFLLAEEVERALAVREPFGGSEWAEYVDESASKLRFGFDGKKATLPEILNYTLDDPEASRRFEALKSLSTGLTEQNHERLAARALNVVLGEKAVDDRERGFREPMSSRNLDNQVDDDTVDALHVAVGEYGATEAQRFYRLVAKHLGVESLKWSDRSAPMPFADTRVIPWSECVDTVLSAYGAFSPALRDLAKQIIDRKWVHAPPRAGKRGGAFNYSVLLPSGEARAYTFLNYMGTSKDVMTFAHELGHGVHGMVAAQAQGALMFRAPMAYAETASIFGEMTTFTHLLAQTRNDSEKLSLLMSKSADFIGACVRQISMSNFERKIHTARCDGKLSIADFNSIYLAETKAFYGEEGELFTYEYTDNLWSYIPHFFRPFYVYAYAFGELFTQSLYARRSHYGDDFEAMYLELLRAGGSKNAVELMAPFELDPRDPDFWRAGIQSSISVWLDEAEALSTRRFDAGD